MILVMSRYLAKSALLLFLLVIIVCILYPLALWILGQIVFPFQANGSIILGDGGKPIGSMLIAQPFTKDEYFQPRPSAASYDASASASSSLAASNYALRNRVARSLGPVVRYGSGLKTGQLLTSDIDHWLQQDYFQGKPHIVAQWAAIHESLAKDWATTNPAHSAFIENWAKTHAIQVAHYIKEHPNAPKPKASDLASTFFRSLSQEHPGHFPIDITKMGSTGKTETTVKLANSGKNIEALFFDMWRFDHPDVDLQAIPADQVMTSASGLDPHITLENARDQLERVASKWASDLKRDPNEIKKEIEEILKANTFSPFGGLAGPKIVNVLLVNLELTKRFGPPK
jgi:potassium-transporting ATPase KdpC subunit